MSFNKIYKCHYCNGNGYIEKWADKNKNVIKSKFNKLNSFFRVSTCDNCIGTGINLHKMSNSILYKGVW